MGSKSWSQIFFLLASNRKFGQQMVKTNSITICSLKIIKVRSVVLLSYWFDTLDSVTRIRRVWDAENRALPSRDCACATPTPSWQLPCALPTAPAWWDHEIGVRPAVLISLFVGNTFSRPVVLEWYSLVSLWPKPHEVFFRLQPTHIGRHYNNN